MICVPFRHENEIQQQQQEEEEEEEGDFDKVDKASQTARHSPMLGIVSIAKPSGFCSKRRRFF